MEERLAGYVRSTYRRRRWRAGRPRTFYDVARPLRSSLPPRTPGSDRSATRRRPSSCRSPSCSSACPSSCATPRARRTNAPTPRPRGRSTTSTRRAGARASLQDRGAARLRPRSGADRRGDARWDRPATPRLSDRARRHGDGDVPLRLGEAAPLAGRADGVPGRDEEPGAERLTTITFHQTGEAALEAGRVREALGDFRRLDAQHPREALHACQIARAYLEAGLGPAARTEAKRARSARPQVAARASGRSAGRWSTIWSAAGSRRGADPRGRRRPTARRWSSIPTISVARASLAILLEHDTDGEQTYPVARLPEVVRIYEAIEKDGDKTFAINQTLALLHQEKFKAVIERTRTASPTNEQSAALLASLAATQGATAALREAGSRLVGNGQRAEILRLTGAELLRLRRYPEAAAFYDQAARDHTNGAALHLFAERLHHARRCETVKPDLRKPTEVARALVIEIFKAQAANRLPTKAALAPLAAREFVDALARPGRNRTAAACAGDADHRPRDGRHPADLGRRHRRGRQLRSRRARAASAGGCGLSIGDAGTRLMRVMLRGRPGRTSRHQHRRGSGRDDARGVAPAPAPDASTPRALAGLAARERDARHPDRRAVRVAARRASGRRTRPAAPPARSRSPRRSCWRRPGSRRRTSRRRSRSCSARSPRRRRAARATTRARSRWLWRSGPRSRRTPPTRSRPIFKALAAFAARARPAHLDASSTWGNKRTACIWPRRRRRRTPTTTTPAVSSPAFSCSVGKLADAEATGRASRRRRVRSRRITTWSRGCGCAAATSASRRWRRPGVVSRCRTDARPSNCTRWPPCSPSATSPSRRARCSSKSLDQRASGGAGRP